MADSVTAMATIRAGDILLYRAAPGIGSVISWGEWSGEPGEALQYSHAGIVLNPATAQGYEQNPPSTHYVNLLAEPWDRIDVWRVNPQYYVDAVKLEAYAAAHLNIPYPYEKYFRFVEAALLARVGLIKAALAIDDSGGRSDPHWEECSATACATLNAAITDSTGLWPKIPENMRPADIPLGKVFRVL